MSFWTYMLHCYGGSYYVGHTDDLESRIAAHQCGKGSAFTSERLPVTLVWAEDFADRSAALEIERRIKGWSCAKKMALIRQDWGGLSELSRKK